MSKLAIRGHGFRNVWFDLVAMDNGADIDMSHMEKSYEETIDALKQRNRELTERLEELSGMCQGYAAEIEIGNEEYMKLHARLEAAERLVAKWRVQDGADAGLKGLHYADELEAAIGHCGSGACSEDTLQLAGSQSAAPVKPVAGEEK